MDEMNDLFYREPYCREFDSVVVSCQKCRSGYEAVLQDTAFYPEGGGQPGDQGSLNGIAVKDTRKKDGRIIHILDHEIPAGSAVHGIIDWQRRFDNMQQHSGEHIVSGLIHQKFGYENIGFHMGEDVITIDFNGPMSWEDCLEIEEKSNEILWADEPIEITFPSKEELEHLAYRSKKELTGKVRIVTIPNADVCACCGTHVSRTGEIGVIKLLSLANRKTGVRIEMVCGKRALKWFETISSENTKISQLTSSKPQETSKGVEKVLKDLDDLKMKEISRQRAALEKKLEELQDHEKLVIESDDDMEMNELRRFCDQAVEKKNAVTAAGLSRHGDRYNYVIISKTVNLRDLSREINSRLNGRGGGDPSMIQGSFQSDEETIRSVLKELLGA